MVPRLPQRTPKRAHAFDIGHTQRELPGRGYLGGMTQSMLVTVLIVLAIIAVLIWIVRR
jgi:hypothetical protein